MGRQPHHPRAVRRWSVGLHQGVCLARYDTICSHLHPSSLTYTFLLVLEAAGFTYTVAIFTRICGCPLCIFCPKHQLARLAACLLSLDTLLLYMFV